MIDDNGEAARVRAALASIAGRSPLQDWLRRNRALVEARFAAGRPRWASVAGVLADLGVVDARGQPPTAQAARQAWYRVRAEGPSQAPAAARPSPSPPPAPPPSRTRPAFDPTEGAFEAKPPPRFRPASLK